MRILINASSSDSDFPWCSYAIAELGDVARQQLLQRRELVLGVKHRDPGLRALTFWDSGAEFYDTLDLDALSADEHAKLAADDYVVLPDGFVVAGSEQRTDGDLLYLDDEGFYWRANLRHADVTGETWRLPYELVLP